MVKEIPFKDHEEWLSIRKKYIGGSDAGAIVGLDEYKTPYSLWAEKTGKTEGFGGISAQRLELTLKNWLPRCSPKKRAKRLGEKTPRLFMANTRLLVQM